MGSESNANIRIGDVLLEMGDVSADQIRQALTYQKEHRGVRMGDALIALGFVTEKQVLKALAARLNYELVSISDITVDVRATELVPKVLAEKYCMMGYAQDGGTYYLLVNDPMNFYGIEDIRQIVGMELSIALCERAPLENAINYYYSEVLAKEAADQAAREAEYQEVEEPDLEDLEDEAPIINLFNSLLIRGVNAHVSDIHIEPHEHETLVRMRMDGVIIDFMTLPKSIHQSLIARIKILGEMDIAERRIPQDGHFKTNLEGQNLNVRVSVVPTVFGEKAVLRLLSGGAQIDHEEHFGMDEYHYDLVKRMLQSPNGIIYVTGPTGSGKSTTLYMILEKLSKRSVNIATIEDPVEKNLPRLNQMQVNPQAGLTFETGLRAILRQDPDIIMVGETRDSETASISVRAAITGHLVFSTLHTNDAASAVVRLTDMGVEPYMAASSLVGIIAQRLVRKVCPFCGRWDEMTREEEMLAGKRFLKVKRPVGCRQCSGTGYKGRIAVHEILPVTKPVREMIAAGAVTEQLKDFGVQKLGMRTLKAGALELVEQGVTSMEELAKVAYYD